MDVNKIEKLLLKKLSKEQILINEPMKNNTTFKIGGPAALFVKPYSNEEVAEVVKLCNKEQLPYFILGNGSNLLVADEGYEGVVIQLYSQFSEVWVHGNQIKAQAGALLSKVANKALEHHLTGAEFAHGIPGTLGGAVVMNAGAYDGEMKDVLISSEVLTPEGEILTLSKEDLALGYRTSIIQVKHYIVLSATLALHQGNYEVILEKMKDFTKRRRDKQPLDMPSAGSTFKRPKGYFAGKLIMDSQLSGYRVGGAMISDKHCGFVVNVDEATCEDVKKLIHDVQERVYQKFNVMLEPELKTLGFKL